jgi:hypothetical protein
MLKAASAADFTGYPKLQFIFSVLNSFPSLLNHLLILILQSHKAMRKLKSFIRHLLIIALLIAGGGKQASAQVYADERTTGYGIGLIYNFMTEGIGAELRAKIPLPPRRLFVVPEVSYFPSFNPYHELYAGAALHYELFNVKWMTFYLAGGGYYNKWFNWDEFTLDKKEDNFVYEAGAGVVRNRGCIRPFIEDRYDFKWKENNLHIGIYWYPGSCHGKVDCPAFNN